MITKEPPQNDFATALGIADRAIKYESSEQQPQERPAGDVAWVTELERLLKNKAPGANRAHDDAANAVITYAGSVADLNQLARYVSLLEAAARHVIADLSRSQSEAATTVPAVQVEAPLPPIGPTGREPEMLQDADRKLSIALSNTPGARLHATEAAAAISAQPAVQQDRAAVRMLTRDEIEKACGFGVTGTSREWDMIDRAIRIFCKVNGLRLSADAPKEPT